ncbi:MAG: hypothetical protein CME02_00010 [Geminicoccus sp.]|nr:hypothetical protein [Geminicoccus sp.]
MYGNCRRVPCGEEVKLGCGQFLEGPCSSSLGIFVAQSVIRPGGRYPSAIEGELMHLKKLVVKLCFKLAPQKHFHDAGHWVMLRTKCSGPNR